MSQIIFFYVVGLNAQKQSNGSSTEIPGLSAAELSQTSETEKNPLALFVSLVVTHTFTYIRPLSICNITSHFKDDYLKTFHYI